MKLFHRHKWKVKGAIRMRKGSGNSPYTSDVTDVLLVCDCGQFKTKEISGIWTVDDLQPKPDQEPLDESFLKKLGVKL